VDPVAEHAHENFDSRIRRLEKVVLGNGEEGLCDVARHTRDDVKKNTITLGEVKVKVDELVIQRKLEAARKDGQKQALAQVRALVGVSLVLGLAQVLGLDLSTWVHALLNLP
jgi:hypothetical protein